MKTVKLIRTFHNPKQILGAFLVTSEMGVEFMCKTLELANKENRSRISCIPAGQYLCKYTKSPSFSASKKKDVYTYEVLNVPDRSGIRIHTANFHFQIFGCIALGAAHKDLNADGEMDVVHSGNTCTEFENVMQKKDFVLHIVDLYE